LQDRVRSLEEANRENRRIIAALTSRIPAIEAPADRAVGEPDHGEPDRPSQIEDPGPPRWTMLLLSLSALGVGSAPLFSFLLNDAGNPTPLANVPYALFVLPFIFGLYRGVWTKRKTEFIEFIELAAEPSDRQEVEPSPGANSINTAGGLETIYALAVATGAALVAVVQSYVVLVLIFGNPLNNPGVLRQIFLPAIFGFIGTFLFFVFAELIGVAIGGRQDRGGRLAPASWWNPQLIFGLVGTIITTVGAVIAAMAGGG
jgi:hypothetical protein